MIIRAFDVIHPEVILDRRGPTAMREMFQNVFSRTQFVSDGRSSVLSSTDASLMHQLHDDYNLARMVSISKTFIDRKAKVYAMGKSIMQSLLEVDTKIPLEILPERWIGYIVFPHKTIFDGDDFYQGAYVWCDTPRGMGMTQNNVDNFKRSLCIVGVTEGMNKFCSLMDHVDSNNLLSAGSNVKYNPGAFGIFDTEKLQIVNRAALSAAIFINSDEPDLRDAKPFPKTMSQTQAKKANKDFIEAVTMPVTLVDWSWVPNTKGAGKDLWYRKPHWSTRWTGQGRTVLRAVFVKGCWNERAKE